MKKLRLKRSTRLFQGHQVGKRWSHSLTLGWLSLRLLLTCAISPSPLHESQPCCGKGACRNQWNYEPCHSGPLKMDKSWWRVLTKQSTGKGNGKPLQYSCLENPINHMKRQKDMTLKDEHPRLVGAQYATGEEWRNSSRRNEETEPSKNNAQLWMWPVVKVKSSAVKNTVA